MANPAPRIAEKHPILVYTAARFGLLLLVGLPLYLAGARGLLLLAGAFLISGLMSFVLLDGTRSRFSGSVSGFFGRINDRIDAAARAEDDENEEDDEVDAESADDATDSARSSAGEAIDLSDRAGSGSPEKREPEAEANSRQ